MSSGIRATVAFDTPDACPLASLSAAEGATIRSVSRSVCPADGRETVTEFRIETDGPVEDDRFTPVISYESTDIYRFEHDSDEPCPCAHLGRFGCPATRCVAGDSTLTVVFHAADFDGLQELVAVLREQFPGIDIRRLVRNSGESPPDAVFVDRSRLTDRQLEVLETAYEMGYFERPKRANAGDVAAELDINPSTFTEHVTAAQHKLFQDVLE